MISEYGEYSYEPYDFGMLSATEDIVTSAVLIENAGFVERRNAARYPVSIAAFAYPFQKKSTRPLWKYLTSYYYGVIVNASQYVSLVGCDVTYEGQYVNSVQDISLLGISDDILNAGVIIEDSDYVVVDDFYTGGSYCPGVCINHSDYTRLSDSYIYDSYSYGLQYWKTHAGFDHRV